MTNSGVGYFDDEFKWPVEQVEAKQVGIASRDLSAYPEDIQKNSTCQIQGKITNIN